MSDFNGVVLPIKYLFEADFKDGTKLIQDKDDLPLNGVPGSSFSAVVKAIEGGKELSRFRLVGEGRYYELDMETGDFFVSAFPFRFHEADKVYKDRRLIFFRRRVHYMNTAGNHLGLITRYRMGWQALEPTQEGDRNVQFVMEFE